MSPTLCPDGLRFFEERLKLCRCFVEYGCGGTTLYAANHAKVPAVFSVDTGANWISKVSTNLSSDVNISLAHVDLGPVGDWGVPASTIHYNRFWEYPTIPWTQCWASGAVPDTILIDGRFRVACFLYTLLKSRIGSHILFDDYFTRPEYFVAERFSPVRYKQGRMAVFVADREFNIGELVAEFGKHLSDLR